MMALIVIMIFFEIVTNGTLLQPVNLTNLILQNSYVVVMALGMLLVIVAWTHRPLGRTPRSASSAQWRPC